MTLSTVLRHAVLVFSSAVMVVGVLVMMGVLAPRYFHEERFRIIMGAVLVLYGAYRFVVTFFRGRGLRPNDDEDD